MRNAGWDASHSRPPRQGREALLRRRSKIIEQWQFSSRLNCVGRFGMLYGRQLVECGICSFRRHAFVNLHEDHRAARRLERALSTSPFSPAAHSRHEEKNATSAPNARATSSAASLAASSPKARHNPAITAAAFDEPPPRPASERNMLFDMDGNMPLFVAGFSASAAAAL